MLLAVPIFAHSANDLDKWNSEQGRVARSSMKDKIATTTYRELPNHVDSSYRSTANGGKVLRQLETSAEVKGSRVGTTINALKEVDKYGAAKKFASEMGKGAVRYTAGAILIEMAMQEMLDGIGWIIDEGGKVTQKPKYDVPVKVTDTCANGWGFGSSNVPISSVIRDYVKNNSRIAGQAGRDYYSSEIVGCNGFSNVVVEFKYKYCTSNCSPANARTEPDDKTERKAFVSSTTNNTSTQPESDPVPEAEMIEKIRQYFENPQSPQSKDLLIEQAVKPKGKASIKWSDDPSSEQTIYSDNKKTAEKVLDSNDPKGEGLTKETPKIIDGTAGSADTTPKPDSGTGTNPNPNPDSGTDPNPNPNPTPNPNPNNGSSTSFNLPAFCDWASIVCGWIDWTKEEPELEGEKLDIEEQDITDYKYEDHVEWGSSCPFFEKTENLNMGVGVIKVKYNLSFFCDFGHSAKSTIVAIGHLGALIFLMIGIRSGASG